jgi:type II secretory pathway pseudopilin PulG
MKKRVANIRSAAGYTLVELLTVLVTFGTVTSALTGLFVSATEAEVQSNRRFQAQNTARLGLDKLRREVHCANNATVTGGGAHVVLDIPNSLCKGYPNVAWCAIGSGTRFALYRKAGTTCDATGTKYIDYLTTNVLFVDINPTTDVLGKLRVTFPVNTLPSKAHEGYSLADELTLRNSQRL